MFFEIHESGDYVWISAFEGKTDVDDVLGAVRVQAPKVSVQLVDLDRVPGSRYLFLAAFNAIKSFGSKEPIARSLGMEILLYIAADRQIGEALKRVGVSDETKKVAVVAVGKSKENVLNAATLVAGFWVKESSDVLLDEWNPDRMSNIRSGFDIGEKELKAIIRKDEAVSEAVERLAIERSAMLAVKK